MLANPSSFIKVSSPAATDEPANRPMTFAMSSARSGTCSCMSSMLATKPGAQHIMVQPLIAAADRDRMCRFESLGGLATDSSKTGLNCRYSIRSEDACRRPMHVDTCLSFYLSAAFVTSCVEHAAAWIRCSDPSTDRSCLALRSSIALRQRLFRRTSDPGSSKQGRRRRSAWSPASSA